MSVSKKKITTEQKRCPHTFISWCHKNTNGIRRTTESNTTIYFRATQIIANIFWEHSHALHASLRMCISHDRMQLLLLAQTKLHTFRGLLRLPSSINLMRHTHTHRERLTHLTIRFSTNNSIVKYADTRTRCMGQRIRNSFFLSIHDWSRNFCKKVKRPLA